MGYHKSPNTATNNLTNFIGVDFGQFNDLDRKRYHIIQWSLIIVKDIQSMELVMQWIPLHHESNEAQKM